MTNSFLKLATEGNKAAILKQQIICQYILGGDSSITDLSKAVNLSVPTVTKLIGELIDEGFVHNFGEQGTAGGRRPNIYGLNPYAGYFVGVDLRKDSVMMAAMTTTNTAMANSWLKSMPATPDFFGRTTTQRSGRSRRSIEHSPFALAR